MAELSHELGAAASAAVNSVMESFHSTPQQQQQQPIKCRRDVHQMLGGGRSADILLWKQKQASTSLLVGSTVAWFLFEWSGYTLLSLFSNVLLILIVLLFLWATGAALLNRPPPPIPEIVLTEEMVHSFASTLRVEINKALLAAHDVAIGKDFRVFAKVTAALWILSKLGAWFNFLTLVYILIVGAHTLPALYDKYQDQIETLLQRLFEEAKKQYFKIDANVLSKIPRTAPKKAQ